MILFVFPLSVSYIAKFTGAEVLSADVELEGHGGTASSNMPRPSSEEEAPLTEPQAGVDAGQVVLAHSVPSCQHLPASSLFPASSHLFLGLLWWQYPAQCFTGIWYQIRISYKIWNTRGRLTQPGGTRRTSWRSSGCPTKRHTQKLPRS